MHAVPEAHMRGGEADVVIGVRVRFAGGDVAVRVEFVGVGVESGIGEVVGDHDDGAHRELFAC